MSKNAAQSWLNRRSFAQRPERYGAIRSGLQGFRRFATTIASILLFFFGYSTLAPAMAWAQPEAPNGDTNLDAARNSENAHTATATAVKPDSEVFPEAPVVAAAAAARDSAQRRGVNDDQVKTAVSSPTAKPVASTPAAPPEPNQSLALPTGGSKTGVTGKAISLPQGSGKIQGMGESFSAQLSTGIATFDVPFSLPHARGGAQPALGLGYSSGSGFGVAGVGWDVGVTFIARQTDRGLPSYKDGSGFDINQDRFVFSGGQELVPICVVTSLACAGAPGEVMPAWSEGAQYFRARVEGSFERFFWGADHQTWRVQDKSGITMELGVPLDGSNDRAGLETNPNHPEQIYRWLLVRQYDPQGASPSSVNPAGPAVSVVPNNALVYRYFHNGGTGYLSDIYDTTPAATPATTITSLFAHHTRLLYEQRPDPTSSYRSGWRIDQALRLRGVDVASKTFGDLATATRHQVRRYHLSYDGTRHVSLLASVQVEGRCSGTEAAAPGEQSGPVDPTDLASRVTETLPDGTNCDALPPMTFGYSHVTSNADLHGYEGFNHDLRSMASSPPHSVDDAMTDLFDINSDGLPDVLNTAVGTYGDGHGVFFNSAGGKGDSFGKVSLMTVAGVLGANANTLTFRNLNLTTLDLDGDGVVNLLHMPATKTYSLYSPQLLNGGWTWVGRTVATASGQSPKIDFGKDTTNTKIADVNGDGLVDLVVSTGTEYQTFFSLGRIPQGDGQFGQGSWATASIGKFSSEPVRACVPWSAAPVQLSDADTELSDMNGDGFPDIVRMRRGDIRYWPGRGDGTWGTGEPSDCTAGSFSSNGYVAMGGPEFADIQGTSLRTDDVNGDGLADLVQINYDSVELWLNVDGKGWTDPHTIPNTPKSPSFANRVRLTDVNGSGTPDILWANAGSYQYIDLEGGQKSLLLTHVENGLGESTDIEYSTSTAEMIAADSLRQCDPVADATLLASSPWSCAWTMKMPSVANIVKRVTESDNLSVAGSAVGKYVTEYQYRDPLFEGRQREFRGFTRARSKHIGDLNSPSDYTESAFLLGECEDETPSDGIDNCALSERWRDNPREALKGLPIFTEKYDERGVYLSTESSTYRLRRLYLGLDGREVRQAFESGKKTVIYDTALGPQAGTTVSSVNSVNLQLDRPAASWDPVANQVAHPGQPSLATDEPVTATRTSAIPVRASAGTAILTTSAEADYFGNQLVGFDFGCQGADACQKADVANGAAADETIAKVTRASRVSGDLGGWLWRTNESWVTGSAHIDTRAHVFTTYDSLGNATLHEAELLGTVALDRFTTVAADGTAPIPAGIAHNGRFPLSTSAYNALGEVVQETAPVAASLAAPSTNARCRDVSYDSDIYSEFAVRETVHTSGGCSTTNPSTSLSTVGIYDRGFGLPISVLDMQSQSTLVDYDAFGRLSAIRRPKPDVDGAVSDIPSVKLTYTVPSPSNPVKYSVIRTQTQDGSTYTDGTSYIDAYAYVDGLGRTRVALGEADKSANDLGAYVASGVTFFDAKGAVSRKYLDFFSDADPANFPLSAVPSSGFGRQRYDAFGRQVQTFDLDGTVTMQSVYHALAIDLYDAADLESGPHQGSYATTLSDGHGRTIATTERLHVNGAIEAREVREQFLTSGEPEVITRVHVNKSDPPVVRWMRYDSLGRLVLNVDPNTTKNFNPSPSTDATPSTTGLKAWRYAYDYAGEMVATSDARGCGENFAYDSAGRLLTEDFSPCGSQGPYTPPAATGLSSGYEVVYWYDSAPLNPFPETTKVSRPGSYATSVDSNGASHYLRGRLVASWSRGQTQWNSYDARGRVTQTAVLPALPLDPVKRTSPAVLDQRFGRRFYYRDFVFDAADREVSATTGSTVAQLQGTANASQPSGASTSAVVTQYSQRGSVKKISSTYGDLVSSVTRRADGLVTEVVYGDIAHTTTDSEYDVRRRLRNVQTYRGPPNLWNTPTNYTPVPTPNGATPSTFQLVLQDQQISYDVVGNPTEVHDYRSPQDWPNGAKPVTKQLQYDDLNRVTRIDYRTAGGSDPWTSPFAPELAGVSDPRRPAPGTHVAFDSRILNQTFAYDWLGNTQSSDDDAHGFYDRSLGSITNDTAGSHPYQLKSASNKAGAASTRNGSSQVAYDDAGNVKRINLERNGSCLPAGSPCSSRWDLQYDEVGRLSRVFRLDMSSASLPAITTDTTAPWTRDLQFLYDEDDQRTIKMSTDVNQVVSTTLYPYETLEVRGTALDPTFTPLGYSDTALGSSTEVPYLIAHGVRLARLQYEPASKGEPRVGTTPAAALHVLFELGDSLGSTSLVVDLASSELVEASTYQGYGAKESDYRPDRWKGFRDDYGFTGKEDDTEFGIIYFGKRFYSPGLNRWLTPDPLAVHAPGQADLNLYAYVRGQVLKQTDPLGLEGENANANGDNKGSPADRQSQKDFFSRTPAQRKRWQANERKVGVKGDGAGGSPARPKSAPQGSDSAGVPPPPPPPPPTLGDGKKGGTGDSVMDTILLGLAFWNMDAPKTDGPTDPHGVPGGGCDTCKGGLGAELLYIANSIGLVEKAIDKAAVALAKVAVHGIAMAAHVIAGAIIKDAEKLAIKGGTHEIVRAANIGGQVHHIPSAQVNGLSHAKGPAIHMDTADHMMTGSWGSSKEAQAFRAREKSLIDQGRHQEAQQLGIDDIRSKFGTKYDEHLKQLPQYNGPK